MSGEDMNSRRASWIMISVGLLFAAADARAGDLPNDWNSVRAAGMGGAFTAASVDDSGPFYNPAGVAKLRNPRSKKYLHSLNVPGLMIGGNSLALKGINAALTSETYAPESTRDVANAPSDWFQSDRFGRVLAKARENPGDPLYAEMQLYPVAVMGSRGQSTYALGLPMRSEFTLGVPDKNDLEKAYVNSRTTLGGLIAVANSLRAGLVNYGVALRPNYRYSYFSDSYPTSSGAFSKFRKTVQRDANKTTGIQADAGLLFIIPDFWFPTLGLAIRNIPTACVDDYPNPVTGKSYTVCGSKRTGAVSEENSGDRIDPTEVRTGFAITPRFKLGATRVNLRLAVDAYPLPIRVSGRSYGFSDLGVNEVIRGGAELFFGNALGDQNVALRGGIHGQNMSWGATIALFGLELEYAAYPGHSLIPGKEERKDRRHLIGISTRW